MQLKYDNITISGGVAVGKNTLRDNLLPFLEPYGWKFKSAGQIVRDYTNEHKLPLATLVSDEFNKNLEDEIRKILETEKNWMVEAWLGGFTARHLQNTLRILLVCTHNELRVDRVANREKVSILEAKHLIKDREQTNFDKYHKLYGEYNFWDPKYYHLVIDTYSSGQLETVGIVLDELGYDQDKIKIEKK
jgi:cytidylate kinase